MELQYKNKYCQEHFLKDVAEQSSCNKLNFNIGNLFHCENLNALMQLVNTPMIQGKVDLIYIDPPFATNLEFNMGSSRVSTISYSKQDEKAYDDKIVGADFLEFIRLRLILLRELLSENGSIYLHIDYKIGHYVKIIMDEVFGSDNFINDISRIKCNPKNFKRKAYGNVKDMILFYSKGKKIIWNDVKESYSDQDIKDLFKKVDEDGREYTTIPLHAPGETKNGKTAMAWRGILPPQGRHWRASPEELEKLEQQGLIEWSELGNPRKKIYADERDGKKVQDIWKFKDPVRPIYPTEKNTEMLKHIILNSSNKDSLILDCFAGSGGTLLMAENLGRRWIGVDSSAKSIETIKKRLDDSLVKYNLIDGL